MQFTFHAPSQFNDKDVYEAIEHVRTNDGLVNPYHVMSWITSNTSWFGYVGQMMDLRCWMRDHGIPMVGENPAPKGSDR